MYKKLLAIIISATFLFSGCVKDKAAVTAAAGTQNSQVTVVNTDDTQKTNKTETPAGETVKASTTQTVKLQNTKVPEKAYFGQYVIKKLLSYGPVSTYGNEDIQAMTGKKIIYSKEKAGCFGDEKDSLNQTAENPIYKEEVISKADFESDNRITFEKLGLKGDRITQVKAEDSKGNGSVFYIKDNNTIILYGGGIYLELIRDE